MAGFQTLRATYKILDNGQMAPKEEFQIDNDTFALVKNIKAELYDTAVSSYREIRIPAGEKLTLYKTDMKEKLYFKRKNVDKGYIKIKFIDIYEGFSVDGINLTDYFDGPER